MKKSIYSLLILFCVCLLCVCLVGCNSSSPTEKEAVNSPADTTPEIEDTTEETAPMDIDSFLSALESDIKWALGPRDKIEEISINDTELYIKIMLERNDHTIGRFTSVTDKVLALEDGFDFWDSVTVDFGSLGYITKTKDDIIIDGDTSHFSVEETDIIKN